MLSSDDHGLPLIVVSQRRRRKRLALRGLIAGIVVAGVVALVVTAAVGLGGKSLASVYKAPNLRFVNGDVVTLDAQGRVRRLREFATSGGRFVSRVDASFATVDLQGATVLPGLIDGHGHLFELGLALLLPVVNQATVQGVRAAVEQWIAVHRPAPGSWIRGGGWTFDVSLPTTADLDASPTLRQYRIVLLRVDNHAVWCNGLALPPLPPANPQGGLIVRFPNGTATGVLVDTAMVYLTVPPMPQSLEDEALRQALRMVASVGLTSVHDAALPWQRVEVLSRFLTEGRLSVRVSAMLLTLGASRNLCGASFRDRGGVGRLSMRTVKMFADGSLGGRGAWLLAPYSDVPGNWTGLPFQSAKELADDTLFWTRCGYQPAIHAIGDAAVRASLDAFAAAHPGTDWRPRVEHAQVVAPSDVPRFAQLGAIASMQPTHALSDSVYAEERLGAVRVRDAYAWRSLANASARLVLGSDFPVELPNPFNGLAAAVTRTWFADQRLSLTEALFGFTRGAAFGAFQENATGAIEDGFFADFIVLRQRGWFDAVSANPWLLWNDSTVAETWVGGLKVYPAPAA